MSSSLLVTSKVVFAGIKSTVPRLKQIFEEVSSTAPEPDITTQILGPLSALNLYEGQLAGI